MSRAVPSPAAPLRVRLTTDGARGLVPQQELYEAYVCDPRVQIAPNRDRGPLPVADVRADVDVLIIDGHSNLGDRRIWADVLAQDYRGIVAPVIILGCCWGAADGFTAAIRSCLAVKEAVLIASGGKTELRHARVLYPRVLDTVLALGPDPGRLAPVLHEQLQPVGGCGPRDWSAQLLTPPSAPAPSRPAPSHPAPSQHGSTKKSAPGSGSRR
ncbi:hypothetical protein EV383_6244 [Pseudonocardia sediminis]|uniref:Uncharacterized protein n=1 Tax=Pseudonocardia sediminis TaxID=1397368 RepID=A0A4Q7UA81_PSEST|nr:hypothetical protein [Pseudonocardia sediminis]RZT75503.1 hypothetical protein EV383_6244 [Pseudonocardia sediminis]